MRLPRAEQGRRIPNSEFRKRSVIEVTREEPEHPVVFDKGGIDARDSWHEGRDLRPAMWEVRGLVQRNLPGMRGLGDAIHASFPFDEVGIGRMDAEVDFHLGRREPAVRRLANVRDDAFVRSKIVLLEEDLRHASPDHAEWVGIVAPGLRWREPADVEHPLRLEEPGDRRIDDANVPVVVSERAVVLLLEKVPHPPEGVQGLGHAVGLRNEEGGYRPYAWDGHVPGQPEHTRCLPWRWDPCAGARCPRRPPGGETRRRRGGVRAAETNDRGHPSRDPHAVRAIPARRWRRGVQRIPAPYLPGRRDVRERGSAKPGAAWRLPAIGDATAGRGGPRGARSRPPPSP